MFKLAHFSDVHLGPLPRASFGQLMSKRILGVMSWKYRRRAIHDLEVLSALTDDVKKANLDHIAFTGDLTNISLPDEFIAGADWLRSIGDAKKISYVPGNHDAYVALDWQKGLALLGDYMIGDMHTPGVRMAGNNSAIFPYVRRRRNIAIVGVTSAVPAPWNKAWGEVGQRQLQALEQVLHNLGENGFYRVVMIHHPPLPGQASSLRALQDAQDMQIALEKAGAELVLHGHNHSHMRRDLETATGTTHVLGVPSASARKTHRKPSAAWYQYDIERRGGRWVTDMTIRGFNEETGKMETQTRTRLEKGS